MIIAGHNQKNVLSQIVVFLWLNVLKFSAISRFSMTVETEWTDSFMLNATTFSYIFV